MANDDQRPPDPRVSAYSREMGAKSKGEKRAVPYVPPRISSAEAARASVAPKPAPEKPAPAAAPPSGGVKAAAPVRAPAPPAAAPSDAAPLPPGFIKTTGETSYRKVAKFLVLVGKEEAARILAKLEREQVERVTRELSTIVRVENAEAEALLAEFRSLLPASAARSFEGGAGGIDAARELLRTAFGAEKGDAFLKRAVPESAENPFAFLEDFEGEQIALLLKEESPAAAALVLSRTAPKTAAAAIGTLPPGLRLETLKRIAKLGKVAPETIERTAAALREKARSIGKETARVVDGRSALAEILKRADSSLGERLLEELGEADPELGRDIKDRLFTLDDVVKVEDRAVQEKLRSMSDRDVALLLKGRRPSFAEKLLSNVTAARRAVIAEEREILGAVPRSEADEAARDFLAWFRRGREEGRIALEDDPDVIA